MTDMTNIPMYQKIKEEILHKINTNLLLPGDKLPTEHQLMEQYHVSRITISKALNELKNERILERFPNKGTFVAHTVSVPSLINDATVPSTAEFFKNPLVEIACILPTVTDLFSLSMLNGVVTAFPVDKYLCHFFQSMNSQMENYLLKRCLEMNIAGIVLFPQDQPFFSNELLFMQLQKYPLVLLDRYLPRLDTSYVIADNRSAGELCVHHLHELGHQRIAFVTSTGQDTFSVKYRIEGIRTAAAKLNMPDNSITVIEQLDLRKKISHHQEQFRKLINEERITAFIASECGACAYLYHLFASMNLKVPSNISLLSFDKPIIDEKNPNFFTHINQSEYLMGREAGRILRRSIEEHDTNVYHKVIAPTLEINHSTGAAVL